MANLWKPQARRQMYLVPRNSLKRKPSLNNCQPQPAKTPEVQYEMVMQWPSTPNRQVTWVQKRKTEDHQDHVPKRKKQKKNQVAPPPGGLDLDLDFDYDPPDGSGEKLKAMLKKEPEVQKKPMIFLCICGFVSKEENIFNIHILEKHCSSKNKTTRPVCGPDTVSDDNAQAEHDNDDTVSLLGDFRFQLSNDAEIKQEVIEPISDDNYCTLTKYTEISCPMCPQVKYSNGKEWSDHFAQAHPGLRPLVQAWKTAKRQVLIMDKKHKTGGGSTLNGDKCKTCPALASEWPDLYYHIGSHHEGSLELNPGEVARLKSNSENDMFACPGCPRSFPDSDSLNCHIDESLLVPSIATTTSIEDLPPGTSLLKPRPPNPDPVPTQSQPPGYHREPSPSRSESPEIVWQSQEDNNPRLSCSIITNGNPPKPRQQPRPNKVQDFKYRKKLRKAVAPYLEQHCGALQVCLGCPLCHKLFPMRSAKLWLRHVLSHDMHVFKRLASWKTQLKAGQLANQDKICQVCPQDPVAAKEWPHLVQHLHGNHKGQFPGTEAILGEMKTQDFLLPCPGCKATFDNESILVQHLKAVSNPESWFELKTTLTKDNDADNDKIQPYTCHVCKHESPSPKEHVEHFKAKMQDDNSCHKVNQVFKCLEEGCEYTTDKITCLRRHDKVVHYGIKYPCPLCDFSSHSATFIKQHKDKKHTDPKTGNLYPDHITTRVYSDMIKSIIDKNSFECVYCENIFTDAQKLIIHLRTVHILARRSTKNKSEKAVQRAKDREHKCDICGKLCRCFSFKKTGNCTHKPKCIHENRIIRCPYSPERIFASMTTLRTHNRQFHPKKGLEKLYQCFVCGHRSMSHYGLQRHVETTHENKRQYPCPHCDYRSGQQPTLMRHIYTIHTKPDHLKCKKCSFKTSNRDKFRNHMYKKHPKPKLDLLDEVTMD